MAASPPRRGRLFSRLFILFAAMPLSSVAITPGVWAVCLPMFRILLYFFPDVATMMFPRRGDCDASPARRRLRGFALFANGKNILNMSVVAVIGLKITPSGEKNALREQKNVHLFCRFIFVSYFCAALSGKYAVVAQW